VPQKPQSAYNKHLIKIAENIGITMQNTCYNKTKIDGSYVCNCAGAAFAHFGNQRISYIVYTVPINVLFSKLIHQ